MDDTLGRLKGLTADLRYIENNMNRYIRAIVESDSDEITDINTQRLYDKGTLSTGAKIEPEYSDYTVEYKRSVGAPSNRVTLYDEGDFHGGFYVKPEADHFYISSTDSKTPDLMDDYTPYIFGLTIAERYQYSMEYVVPELIKEIRNRITA